MASNTSSVVIVEMLPTQVWVEDDIFGTRHVVVQHQGMDAFTFASFFYRYGYNDNASLHRCATEFALKLGATEPVEHRSRNLIGM